MICKLGSRTSRRASQRPVAAWSTICSTTPVFVVCGETVEEAGRDLCRRRFRRVDAGEHVGGSGATTTFVCAAYEYDIDVAQSLMRALPDVMHVPTDPVGGRDVTALVELLAREVGEHNAGARSATARLTDL